jgi:hypothetical protein
VFVKALVINWQGELAPVADASFRAPVDWFVERLLVLYSIDAKRRRKSWFAFLIGGRKCVVFEFELLGLNENLKLFVCTSESSNNSRDRPLCPSVYRRCQFVRRSSGCATDSTQPVHAYNFIHFFHGNFETRVQSTERQEP